MAQRYGKLPSEIIAQATTFDFRCMDITESYVNYQRVVQETGRPPPPKLSTAQMKEMMDRANSRKKG